MTTLQACAVKPRFGTVIPPAAKRTASADEAVADYFGDANVRARIVEFCGAAGGRRPTAAYLAALGPTKPNGEPPDLARSLWDLDHLLFFLQLDYVNADHPEEPFVHPADVLLKLEPAYRACRAVFDALDLEVLAITTARGYHFVGQVLLDAIVVEALASLAGETPAWHAGHLARRPRGVTATITARHARAAAGLGLLIEHAAHLILARSWTSSIPFVLNGTRVGTGLAGRECVSIDFSHVGEPLDVVRLRTAFSPYRRHQYRPDLFGSKVAALPPLVALPRDQRPLVTLLTDGRGLGVGREAARTARTVVPDVKAGILRLLGDYLRSPLAAFHRKFFDERRRLSEPVPDWRAAGLAPCIAAPLERPHELLLKPEHVQHVVRGLLAKGWTAAQIAALVQQKFEEPPGWGDRWARSDTRTRADFDVRVFAGLLATGADELIDFNCVSAQEKDICPRVGCPHDLRIERDRLAATIV
ncbi:MAG TPA: hypothetical protein VES67_01805 [Vicinamibacterales bacterium]|nr:hypothetical protein [Vicinamibacterales bacterium]